MGGTLYFAANVAPLFLHVRTDEDRNEKKKTFRRISVWYIYNIVGDIFRLSFRMKEGIGALSRLS